VEAATRQETPRVEADVALYKPNNLCALYIRNTSEQKQQALRRPKDMESWQSEVFSVAPRATWLLMSLGIVLAAEIAAALSLVFVRIIFPLSFNGGGNALLVLGVIFFLIIVPLAGLLAGLPTWWLFVARPRHITLRRGILLGMLSGLIAHPLVWICCLLLLSLMDAIRLAPHLASNFPSNLPSNLPLEPTSNLLLALPLSVLSLILVGWITASVGGIAGGLLVHLQGALMRRMRQQDGLVFPPHG
jgi:hypothetical protein